MNQDPKPANSVMQQTISKLRVCASRFASNQSGAVALIFGIAAIPIIGLIGSSLDYSRATDIRQTYQDAADAAVLAAATRSLDTFEQQQEIARDVFYAHASATNHSINLFELVEHDLGLMVRAAGEMPTTLLSIVGVTEVSVGVEAIAALASQPLEIAFVIDATNSMLRGSRWRTAYGAIEDTLEALDEATTGEDDLFVTVIPMGDTVNIGEANADWVQGLVDDEDAYDDWGPDRQFNYMEEQHWQGCVFAREEPTPDNPYTLTDERPGDEVFGAMDHRLNNHALEGHGSRKFLCPREIIGPSQDVQQVLRDINSITAAGTGRFDQGMAWGWRAVSANWQGEWGIAGYPTTDLDERNKVVVFITDGNSTMEEWRFDGHQDWGYNNAGDSMLGNLVDVCTQAKAQGIEVYTLYVEGNPYAESYMRDCASSADHFFDVTTNSAMIAAFEAMGTRLSRVRLVR